MSAFGIPLSRASSALPPSDGDRVLPGRRPLLPAPAGNTLIRGDLVTYERDPRYAAAWTLYVVLGEPRRDSQAQMRIPIQAIHRQTLYSAITTLHPMDVRVDELVPLAAYGMRISKLVHRLHGATYLFLERDASIRATAPRRFGRPLGNQWDWCSFGSIDSDDLAGLIRDPDIEPAEIDCAASIDADPVDDDPEDVAEEEF